MGFFSKLFGKKDADAAPQSAPEPATTDAEPAPETATPVAADDFPGDEPAVAEQPVGRCDVSCCQCLPDGR